MPTILEFVYVLQGLRRLIQFDSGGLAYFDRSIEGFWRSFRVAVLLAPLYSIVIPLRLELIKPTVGWPEIMIVEILAYIVGWLLYPMVAYEICRRIGRENEYPGHIVVYNWSMMIIVAAQVVVWLPTVMGLMAAATSHSLYVAITIPYFIYLWFIARATLRIDGFSAIGLVVTSGVLSLVLSFVHRTLLGSAAS